MEGFFPASQLRTVQQPASTIPKCGLCGLLKGCKTPKMPAHGSGRRKVLVVGEAPGRHEDAAGKPFVGEAGQLLRRVLKRMDIDLSLDCITTNALACRPPDNTIKDKRAIEWCRPLLLKTIEYYQPATIILLGTTAVKSLIQHVWKDDVRGVKRWAGFQIPCREPNAWVCPTYHPSHVLRAGRREAGLHEMVFERHLRAAFDREGRPWAEVPDYARDVDVITDDATAARVVRKMIQKGGTVAFDYETDRLKPDHPESRIVCCSVCWEGKKTIAYPWRGEVVEATKELLLSPLRKVASNMKFEERWSRARLGVSVVNWHWDTMIQAHVLDCRPGISSIKFQAFVRLGQPDYDGHLKAYLEGRDKGGNSPNRVREVGLPDLLLYCGMDSLLEYKVAELQKKELGVK